MLTIFNTLSRVKEQFEPLRPPRVDVFVCGPTVYDFAHIGHARTYIAFDIVTRYLRHRGYDARYIQNITDIDDKIIARAAERGVEPLQFAKEFEQTYYEDMKALGITSVSEYARATNHIKEIVAQVNTLIHRGHAYLIEGDGYYFDLTTFPAYGKLSRRTVAGAEDAVSRIDESVQKRNKGDFCLWKFSKSGEPSWDSPLGAGRPGWHIEDTAITDTYFGPQYDIHGGARDLIFPHHECEIAQQESASGRSPMVRYWMHTGFLTVGGTKMAKSAGNFMTIRDFLKTHDASTLRMIVAGAHYRSPIDYTEKVAQQAAKQVERLQEFVEKISKRSVPEPVEGHTIHMVNPSTPTDPSMKIFKETEKKFYTEMDDDFNTPRALAAILLFVRKTNPLIEKEKIAPEMASAINAFFKTVDNIFGFGIFESRNAEIPPEVQKLVDEREKARKAKNWQEADRLRGELTKLGYAVDDTPQGSRVKLF